VVIVKGASHGRYHPQGSKMHVGGGWKETVRDSEVVGIQTRNDYSEGNGKG